MKYVLAIALVPIAALELLLRAFVLALLVCTFIGAIILVVGLTDGDVTLDGLVRPASFGLIREVIA